MRTGVPCAWDGGHQTGRFFPFCHIVAEGMGYVNIYLYLRHIRLNSATHVFWSLGKNRQTHVVENKKDFLSSAEGKT